MKDTKLTKNLYLPLDATPERRAAQDRYVAASDRLANGGGVEAMDAYREAERAFGAVLLAEDKIRRPHVYATDREPTAKAKSAKEVIARALYELDPAEDQETDLDGRPVGKPYAITWDHIAEYEAPAVNSFRKDADAILAALDAAGLVVVPRRSAKTTHAERLLPDSWRVGQKVRYLNSSEFAWSRGDIAYVLKLRDEYKGRPAAEYQVFYTGVPSTGCSYWTTPNDVELVEDVASAQEKQG